MLLSIHDLIIRYRTPIFLQAKKTDSLNTRASLSTAGDLALIIISIDFGQRENTFRMTGLNQRFILFLTTAFFEILFDTTTVPRL
ncbi:MAG: hypothetical protein UV70_C0025G0007 [Parcubacteria group bacterium GW2011_GWA2_43_13]|nr:MAG: hypothetical protein UV70_C0025G0007 [Parcubacteria group bacterium GW2011_GWA2_43_13]